MKYLLMKLNFNHINLKSVTKTDHEFLYWILGQRNTETNISHGKMPTFKKHEKFVASKPYKKWYVIKFLDERIGSIYLSYQNEIGLFFKKEYSKTMIANYVLKFFMKKNPQQRYFVNINPRNKKSIKFFTKNGFKILQHTYKLEID